MNLTISILIITYNRPEVTLALLENLKCQNDFNRYVGEVLLLNNASNVSYSLIENFIANNPSFPINYIESDENLGVARGRNFLFRKARYSSLLILDDDMIFPEADAMEKFYKFWEKPQAIEHKTKLITFGVFYFENGERQKEALPHKRYEKYKDKDWFLTYYFAGGANLMRKEILDDVGFLPEDFFYGMEEYDLSYRIINAGYTLAYDDSVKVLHKESPHGRVPPREKLAMMWLNKSKVAWRYLPNRYFYSTAIMWSLQYLKKTKFDLPGFIKTWKKVFAIPGNTPTEKINKTAMSYLKKVEARLWY